MTLFWIGLGGALGTLSRYVVSILLNGKFPLGTLLVNISGAFLLGLVMALSTTQKLHQNEISFWAIGFLGAFTTFSTLNFEIIILIKEGALAKAISYFLLSSILGLIAVYLGFKIGNL